MSAHFKIKGALAVMLLCAPMLPASAQAPPTAHGNPPIWSSHDMQLYRLEEERPVPLPDPAPDGLARSWSENGVICEPQPLFGLPSFLLSDGSGAAETTGAAR